MDELNLDDADLQELLGALAKVSSENKLLDWFNEDYPYSWQRRFFDAGAWAMHRLVMAANGVGKALKNGTGVLTPNGFVPIERLKIGDTVIGGDGQPCNVTGVYPQGKRKVAKIIFDDGVETICDLDHLWKCRLHKGKWQVLRTEDMKKYGDSPPRRLRIPTASCYMHQREVFVDPYVIGVMLGDGSLRESQPKLTTADSEIARSVETYYPLNKTGDIEYGVSGGLVTDLKKMGAYGKLSYEKDIPIDYLMNDRPQRLALLQGLMDTDGTCDKNGNSSTFYSTSKKLADGVVFIVRSLGGKAKIKNKQTYFYHNGKRVAGRPSFAVWIRLDVCPFRLPRKVNRWRKLSTTKDRIIYDIELAGDADCTCITVDSNDHTFVIDDFIVTHNSETVCAEFAMHVTGRYPEWWKGKRFDYGGWEAWIGSIDNDMQKRGPQRALCGRSLEELGTGLIPADAILKEPELRQAGVKSVIDTLIVKHASGRPVTVKWLTFEQGWRKWQSGDPKIILWDEEPDESNVDQKDILSECLTRLVRNNGIWMCGYTPLLGETQLTKHFMNAEDDNSIWYVGATWDDAPHMDEHAREKYRKLYPEHQRDARSKGIPMLGEGRVFSAAESDIVIDPIDIPDHWACIAGIDFGLAHPAAAVWIAHDRDTGKKYIFDCWRKENKKSKEHAEVINSRGDWIPVAWPHDGEKRDSDSGRRLADKYREIHGVNLLSRSARYKNKKGGSQAQWPIIETIKDDMDTGQFFVFRTCQPWLEEFRSYHVKNGQLVDRKDDALKASFYALMDLRYAVSKREAARAAMPTSSRSAPLRTSVR